MVCPKGKILNATTGRCVKEDGTIGKKIIKNTCKYYGLDYNKGTNDCEDDVIEYYLQPFYWVEYVDLIDNVLFYNPMHHQPSINVTLLKPKYVSGCEQTISIPSIVTPSLTQFEEFIFKDIKRLNLLIELAVICLSKPLHNMSVTNSIIEEIHTWPVSTLLIDGITTLSTELTLNNIIDNIKLSTSGCTSLYSVIGHLLLRAPSQQGIEPPLDISIEINSSPQQIIKFTSVTLGHEIAMFPFRSYIDNKASTISIGSVPATTCKQPTFIVNGRQLVANIGNSNVYLDPRTIFHVTTLNACISIFDIIDHIDECIRTKTSSNIFEALISDIKRLTLFVYYNDVPISAAVYNFLIFYYYQHSMKVPSSVLFKFNSENVSSPVRLSMIEWMSKN